MQHAGDDMNNASTYAATGYRRATIAYVVALGIIAGLGIVEYFLNDAIVRRQYNAARLVNQSGRQRMLCQRIALLSLEVSRLDNAAQHGELEERLRQHIADMRKADAALSYGTSDAGGDGHDTLASFGVSHAERAENGEYIELYLENASALLKLPPKDRLGSPELDILLHQARESLMHRLEAVVAKVQAHSEASVTSLRQAMLAALVLMLLAVAAEAMFIFRPLFRKLKAAQEALMAAATTDPLTGCMNRRQVMEAGKSEFQRARRHGQPLAALMLDIDRFKGINDTLGHATGDMAIKALALVILRTVRGSDMLGRLGGDEFVLLLPNTTPEAAMTVAQKLVRVVAEADHSAFLGEMKLTVSVGAANVLEADESFNAVLDRADRALYLSKHAGRNRATALGQDEPELKTGARDPAC